MGSVGLSPLGSSEQQQAFEQQAAAAGETPTSPGESEGAVSGGEGVERFGLVDSFDHEWVKLLLPAVREIGPAAQTLGGLLKLSLKPMFYSAAKIAAAARLPVKTVRNHLLTLHKHGWIIKHGRQKTTRGFLRRTPTISIHQKTLDCLKARDKPGLIYGVLPWWACCVIGKFKRLNWADKVVLSVLIARLMQVKTVADQKDFDLDTWMDEKIGGERFQLSLSILEKETGLSREAVVSAKRQLFRRKIIDWSGGTEDDKRHRTDSICPNLSLAIITTPAGTGRCHLDFGDLVGQVNVDRGAIGTALM